MAIVWIIGGLALACWLVIKRSRRQESRERTSDDASDPLGVVVDLPPIHVSFEATYTGYENAIAIPGKISYIQDVVGESHRNWDGVERQDLLKRCIVTDPIDLVPEPDNRYDPNAIKVMHRYGQLGYIPRGDCKGLLGKIRSNRIISCRVHRIVGGTREKPSRGVYLHVVAEPGPQSKK